MVSLGNGKFIVIEQGAGTDGKVFNRLMLGTDSKRCYRYRGAGLRTLEKSSMSGVAVNAANYANVVTLKKTVLFDLQCSLLDG